MSDLHIEVLMEASAAVPEDQYKAVLFGCGRAGVHVSQAFLADVVVGHVRDPEARRAVRAVEAKLAVVGPAEHVYGDVSHGEGHGRRHALQEKRDGHRGAGGDLQRLFGDRQDRGGGDNSEVGARAVLPVGNPEGEARPRGPIVGEADTTAADVALWRRGVREVRTESSSVEIPF